MSNMVALRKLWSALDELRGDLDFSSVTSKFIAKLAIEHGVRPKDAIAVMQNLIFRTSGRHKQDEILPAFFKALLTKLRTNNILETFEIPSVLTTDFIGSGLKNSVHLVTKNQDISSALQILFGDRAVFLNSLDDIPNSELYDAIICQPPLGQHNYSQPAADGFGGEIVLRLAQNLTDKGLLFWLTSTGAVHAQRAQKTFAELQDSGLEKTAIISLAPGAFPGTNIPGVLFVFSKKAPTKRFIATLRDEGSTEATASALLSGPSTKEGPTWTWLNLDDERTYEHIESERYLKKITPRGRSIPTSLKSVLIDPEHIVIRKAHQQQTEAEGEASFLYVPEYAQSRVTSELDEQTVKPNAVHRFPIHPQKANTRFLAHFLNGPYGKIVRSKYSSGVTIQRLNKNALEQMLLEELPLPDKPTQDRIAGLLTDIGLMQSRFKDMSDNLEKGWTQIGDFETEIDKLKASIDVDKQIAEWWKELPYPLATIYRRFQVTTEPKERLDTLLHFFEMASVYLAVIGVSHVLKLRDNGHDELAKWLHPKGTAGIERADFGFWIGLAATSLKDLSRISADAKLKKAAIEKAGSELVDTARKLGPLGKVSDVLNKVRKYRNNWKGHGGYLKDSDAIKLCGELQPFIREFYERTASTFKDLLLIRPGKNEYIDSAFHFEVEMLIGSDPTFEKSSVALKAPVSSGKLAFWMTGASQMCEAIPFFRLGLPQEPRETSFYVFNRVEVGGESFRWISYQETKEQEFIAGDEQLLDLIYMAKPMG